MNVNLKVDQIMSLVPGKLLDDLVISAIKEIGGEPEAETWTFLGKNAVTLWDLVEKCCGEVVIVRTGSTVPSIISQICTISDPEDGTETTVATGNWIESLGKAFLLFVNGHYGDYVHPEFEKKMREAPKRMVQ